MAAGRGYDAARDIAAGAARRAYTDFRATARVIFTDPPTRQALGLAGVAPVDLQKLITVARQLRRGAEHPGLSGRAGALRLWAG